MRGLQDAAAAGSQRCSQMCVSLNSSHTDAPPVQTFQVSSNSLNHCLCLKHQMKAHLWLLVSILTLAPDPMWHHDCCRGEAARQQRWFPWVQLEILMVVQFFSFLAAMLFYLFNNSLFVPSFQMDESSQLSTVLFWLTAMAAGTLAALFLRWNHWLCWARQMLLKWNILWWAFLFYCLLLLFCTRTVLAR